MFCREYGGLELLLREISTQQIGQSKRSLLTGQIEGLENDVGSDGFSALCHFGRCRVQVDFNAGIPSCLYRDFGRHTDLLGTLPLEVRVDHVAEATSRVGALAQLREPVIVGELSVLPWVDRLA